MIRNGLNRSDISTPESREQARRWLINIDRRRRDRGYFALSLLFFAFAIGCGVVLLVRACS
jgi:hypothetical protein